VKIPIISLALAIGLSVLTALNTSAQGPVKINVTQIDQASFPQINVYVSATDAAGNPVRNLPASAFRLEQNGQPVAINAATRSGEQGVVNTVLVVDHSGSMGYSNKIAGAKQAATAFVNLMRPGDKTALVQFDTQIDTLVPLTDDKSALNTAIQKITPRGNTALYDALAQAGKYLGSTSGRQAIIVVSDGMDNASKTNRADAVKQATQGGYSIYTIGLGNKGAGVGNQEGIDEPALQELANASMGGYAYTPDANQLSALYQQLAILIQNEYKLTYTSPDALRDGVRRNVVVTAPGASPVQTTYNPGGLIPEAVPQFSSWVLFLIALVLLIALFFAPTLLKLAATRLSPRPSAPSRPQPRVKLTGSQPVSGPTKGASPSRPTRIKLGKQIANTGSADMPWDERAAKHQVFISL
jgi:Ca-activated chloride channel homolog